MKNMKFLTAAVFTSLLFIGCSDDDAPEAVNEEEIITTLTVTLVPEGGGTEVILQTRDLDGDGPNAPVITTGNLAAGVTYSGSIVLLNETEEEPDNITEEVEEESDEHQFFYQITNSLATFEYADFDGDSNPIGLEFTVTTSATLGTGTLTITLRHEPSKSATGVSDGDITNAGGETDIQAVFSISVE